VRVVLHDEVFAQGTPDAEWLPSVGAQGWIVFTRDLRLRYRPAEKEALIAAGVRAFGFTSGNMGGGEVAEAIVRALPKIRSLLAAHKNAFVARITSTSDVAIILQG
jgi:hypothetical protein